MFCIHTLPVKPFQMTPMLMTLTVTFMLKLSFQTLLPYGWHDSVSPTHSGLFMLQQLVNEACTGHSIYKKNCSPFK